LFGQLIQQEVQGNFRKSMNNKEVPVSRAGTFSYDIYSAW
jgi:hypothetical protein